MDPNQPRNPKPNPKPNLKAKTKAKAKAAPKAHPARKPALTTDRRTLLKAAPLVPWFGANSSPARASEPSPQAIGPLQPKLPENGGDTAILALPEAFSYRVLQRAGDLMTDGYRVPALPDGMACIAVDDGHWALMRNHELETRPYLRDPKRPPPELVYDARYFGGVSRLLLDASNGTVVDSNLVLTGTARNCSSGPSPFGYLSCEEHTAPKHGYVFRCDPHASTLQAPEPIRGYGRFRHEAVAVDPTTLIAYLTEDQADSCLYRFVPTRKETPFVGRLEALAVVGKPRTDTGPATTGTRFDIDWVPIAEPDPAQDTVRHQGFEQGAARIVRGEGIWLADGVVFFTATTGGPLGRGQLFALDIADSVLTVLAASEDAATLNMPDNLTVSPTGLLVLAEDSPDPNHLRYIDGTGAPQPLARNEISASEFAGPCFSPDGQTLFTNLQADGLTLAITGPFSDLHNAAGFSPKSAMEGVPWAPPAGVIAGSAALSVLAFAAWARHRRGRGPKQAG